MRLSEAGFESVKLGELNETYPGQDILIKTNQIYQYTSGIYGYNNVALRARQNVEKIIRDVLDEFGCIEVLLPTLQPKALWEETNRWQVYKDEGIMMSVKTEKSEYALAPTAEEAVTELVKNKIKSHKSLPFTYYQIGEKYRNELRNRGYLLRGKTFPMMDAYSFDKDKEGLEVTYQKLKNAYIEIFKRLGLEAIPVAADSGAIGGAKSEEFMYIADFGEDTILYDEKSKKGFNIEVAEKENYEEYLRDEYGIEDVSKLVEKKAVELGHIFQLGTKYSEAMDAKYTSIEGKEEVFFMGCYGIGVSRTLAVLYENSVINDKNDKPNGIALNLNIAPYYIQFIPKMENDEKLKEVEDIYAELKTLGVNTIIDDRQTKTIGEKIRDAKVFGTPFIAIVGDKVEKDEFEIENTKTGEKIVIKKQELVKQLSEIRKNIILGTVEDIKEIV